MAQPTIALALGAGGARGIAHIHVLEACDEMGITPIAISGASFGAIIGAGYASGLSGRQIKEYILERFQNRASLLADLWKLRPESIEQFISEGGPRLGEINIERVLDIFLPGEIVDDFSELSIPLQIVATDYYGQCQRVFAEGPIRPAIAASSAIPAIFRSVIIDENVFIDGCMSNPTPFDVLHGKADIVVGIDVSGEPEGTPGKRPNKIEVAFGSIQLLQKSITDAKAEKYQLDILLRPQVGKIGTFDFLNTETVMAATLPIKDELKRRLEIAMNEINNPAN